MTTEIIYGSRAFISRDRNPSLEPATWPFQRAAGIDARSGETPKQGSTRRAKGEQK